MKYATVLLAIFLASCGGSGHIKFYNFYVPKSAVENEIRRVIKDSGYAVPAKWADVGKTDFYPQVYLYLNSNPEELYQIGFIYDSAVWNHSSTCTLALVGRYVGNGWQFDKDLGGKEEDRMMARFEAQILSKIKYSYTKSDY
jgi:hypothetical protein